MIHRLIFTLALMGPCLVQAQDVPRAELIPARSEAGEPQQQPAKPYVVPMAIRALEYIKAQPNSGPTSWTNGPYTYDGAGNIKGIGSEVYVYDMVGRLRSATMRGPDLTSMQTQSFTYDAYGNLTSTTKFGQTVPLTIAPGTNSNRLNGVVYDATGNVISTGVLCYEYDAAGMLSTVRLGPSSAPAVIYAYTADDERLFAFDVTANTTRWTVRGIDHKVLRVFKQSGASWSVERDYVYRDGSLLAALKPDGAMEHYSLDHLGTVRLITDGVGQKIGYHVYWPFGEEWSPGNAQEGSPLKFTGHERDTDTSGNNNPLDYMHARYYRSGWGRFLSVDPALDLKKAVTNPQMWNRYTYASNNPLRYTDPDGRLGNDGLTKPMTRENVCCAPPPVSWALEAEVGLLTLAGGGPVRRAAFEATLLMMRNPGAVLAAMKVLDALGGDGSSHIAIPGPRNAAMGKLDYLLGNVASVESRGKGAFFAGAMGFGEKTLAAAIKSHFADNFAKSGVLQTDGRLAVTGQMTGPSGMVATVKTVWQWVGTTKTWDLITAVPTR